VLSRSEAFMTVATEKLLIYALGRPLHATDMSTVREIVRAGARDGQKFSALVLGRRRKRAVPSPRESQRRSATQDGKGRMTTWRS
jgi:hypothetical protein